MDLTKGVPRSPYEMLGGIVFLPRAIDKMRALIAGTVGEYNARFGTSAALFRRLGMAADEFEQIVCEHLTDEEVLEALRERGTLTPETIDAWNKVGPNISPRSEEEWARHWERLETAGYGDRRDVVTQFDRLDLEARPESCLSAAFRAFPGSSLSGADFQWSAIDHFPAGLLEPLSLPSTQLAVRSSTRLQ